MSFNVFKIGWKNSPKKLENVKKINMLNLRKITIMAFYVAIGGFTLHYYFLI